MHSKYDNTREQISFSWKLLWLERKFIALGLLSFVIGMIFHINDIVNPVKLGLLFCLLLPVAIWDYRYGLIFNSWNIVLAGIGLLASYPVSLLDIFCSALLGGGSLLLLRVVSNGGLGWGDIKLMLALSCWLNPVQMGLALLLAFWLGGIMAALLLLKGSGGKTAVPFGPFLSLGAFIAFAMGDFLIGAYGEYFYG